MKKISLVIAGKHATSVSLEEAFVEALRQIAAEKKQCVNEIVTEIDASRKVDNLSSAIRVYVLSYFKNKNN